MLFLFESLLLKQLENKTESKSIVIFNILIFLEVRFNATQRLGIWFVAS